MRLCQYFAYVEIIDEREAHIFGSTENGTSLWRAYLAVIDQVAELPDEPHRHARRYLSSLSPALRQAAGVPSRERERPDAQTSAQIQPAFFRVRLGFQDIVACL
jgi:hypothetical protein